MPSTFSLKNPHLGKDDYLYHLGLPAADDLETRFGDVKFVCMGGKCSRMKEFAEYMYEKQGKPENSDLDTSLAEDGKKKLRNVSECAGRYSMYKVGPVLLLSHGIGMASLSVALNEVFKLLHYARCGHDVKFIRMGSSGGLGVTPGTLVITKQPYSSTLSPEYMHVSVGRANSVSCDTCPNMRQKLMECAKSFNVPAAIGNTMATDDFFEGQCRLDGAFCDYNEKDKMAFLRKAHDQFGINNIEMESTCFAAMCTKAGLKCAIICATFLDRLIKDIVDASPQDMAKWQAQMYTVVGEYIVKSLKNE